MPKPRQEDSKPIEQGERCEYCGGLLAMIGKRHRCRGDQGGLERTLARPAAPAARGSPKDTKRTSAARKATMETPKPVRKPGRPRKVEQKPWEREGISRAAWYRRQKAAR